MGWHLSRADDGHTWQMQVEVRVRNLTGCGRHASSGVRSYYIVKWSFSATLGEEPDVGVALD
jgi:hypothetical protein